MAEDLQLSVGIVGVQAFNASLKAMENAIADVNESLEGLGENSKPATEPLTGLPPKIKPVEGSIASVSAKLKDLQVKFINTGDAVERSRLKQQMDALNMELNEMSGSAQRAGISLADAFRMAGVSMGLDVIVQGIRDIGSTAFNSAVQYESLGIQLGVLLGDASKVPSVLDEWKKFSDATPFEPDQVNKAGKALLAFGFESDKLIPLMTKIGDVASGTGKDFNELAIIYGKARVAGTLMSEDINQLTEAGIPIMEELAAVLGTSTDKVKKMASEGKITFPLFEQAFGRLTGEGGKFGGMMAQLSLSSEGLISTMKGELEGSLRRLGEQIVPVVIGAMQAMLPVIQGVISIFTDYPEILVAATGAFIAYNAQTIAATTYQAALKVATYASEVATKLLNATMALTPWGIALLGVTALVTAMVAFRDKTDEVSKAQQYSADITEKINEAYAKESAQVNILFDKLTKLNPKSEEARKIRAEINTTYKEYLPNQLKEASNNDEIKRSQDAVNEALRKKIALQVQEQEMVRIYTEQQKVLLGGYDEVKKSVKVSAADFQKAVSSMQNAISKFSAEQRESIFGEAVFDKLIQGSETSLASLINSTAKFANVGSDVRKTLDSIIAGGFESQNAFILSALAVADSEDQLKILTDLINQQTTPAVTGLSTTTTKSKEELEAAAKKAKELAERLAKIQFKPEIMFEFQDAPSQEDLDKIFGVSYEESVARANAYADYVDQVVFQNDRMAQHMGGTTLEIATFWERMTQKIGEDAASKLKEGINQIKGAFRDFGISAVESFGYAIGAGESAGAAFKKLVMGLMVEVPKLAGMALLNAAATTPGPQALPMAIAGLALIGLSGLLGGLASKADQDTAAMNNMMDELPSGATGAGGGGGVGGLGGFSAGNQVQPIQVNVNAEMDGVQLGGLFKRVTNNYNKTVVKQF